MLLDSVWH